MIAKRKSLLMVALLVVAGCSKEAKMPEVNEENCNDQELISKLPFTMHAKFSYLCDKENKTANSLLKPKSEASHE